VKDLTQVLDDNNKELEEVIDEHKKVLAAALKERDDALAATTAAQKQLMAWKKKHEADLVAEREASSGTILALQQEKTAFEGFIREMSRQLLGKFRVHPSPSFNSASPRAWRVRKGRVPERRESSRASPRPWRLHEHRLLTCLMCLFFFAGTYDYVETTTPRECLETRVPQIIKLCGGHPGSAALPESAGADPS
jgi:hypothetical protein